MAKDSKKENEEMIEGLKGAVLETTFLIIAGTSIQFKDGVYSTSDETEIEILRNNNLVTEAGE